MANQIDQYYKTKMRRKTRMAFLFGLTILLTISLIGYLIAENQNQLIFTISLAFIVALIAFFSYGRDARRWRKSLKSQLKPALKTLLKDHVSFYRQLDDSEKVYFEQRINYFLHHKKITPVDCEIDDRIRLYVAASAIIPIFSFPDFYYRNINEVLIYPDSFDEEYNMSTPENRKRIAGMVGNGVMSRMMILSKRDLLRAFDDTIDADNVAIHEFVHLIDMADGLVDGIPKSIMDNRYTIPWISEIHREMNRIKGRKSDIDNYSLTNNAEFLAVVSEYFFDSPDKFRDRHPGLYELLAGIFKYNM